MDKIIITPGAEQQLAAWGLDTVERVLGYRGGRFAAISSTSETIEVMPPVGQEGGSLFLKRYRYPKRSQRLRTLFRGGWFGRSRAFYEYHRLRRFQANEVPTITPLAVGYRKHFGLLVADFLITAPFPGQSLLSYVRSQPDLSFEQRQRLARDLAELVRRMHRRGIVHGSLVWRDILVRQQEDGSYSFALIDPGRVGRFAFPGCGALGVRRDLAELTATGLLLARRSDRVRFAHAYGATSKLSRGDRCWWARVVRQADRLKSQEEHRMEVNDIFLPARGAGERP